METKDKFLKNIFTEKISGEDSQNNDTNNTRNEGKLIVKNDKKSQENMQKIAEELMQRNFKEISPKKQRTINKLKQIITAKFVDINSLKNICWQGIPEGDNFIRAECWKYLLGFYPTNNNMRNSIIVQKNEEYDDICKNYEGPLTSPDTTMNDEELKTYRQILKDVPRTMPEYRMSQIPRVKFILTRILYIWSIRHPASGYVQGLNDLAVPFILVYFLAKFPGEKVESLLNFSEEKFSKLGEEGFLAVETDVYFSLVKLLDPIQINYIKQQPGIKKMIQKMGCIVKKVDRELFEHLNNFEIDYIQFCFRWMNCYLIREFKIELILRMWDTYLSEDKGFSDFHYYVCACLLLNYSEKLKAMNEFPELIVFLQNLPTQNWTLEEIDALLARAYSIKQIYSCSNIFKDEENVG